MPNPDNARWLSLLLEREVPPGSVTSVDQIPMMRAGADLTVNNVDLPELADHRVGVVLRERDGLPLTAEISTPFGDGPFPVVVYFHGGGFCIADAAGARRPSARIAAGAGAVVVNVDYGLAPERPFPWAVEDAVYACRWVVANATELNIDPQRFGVAGDSAGANLAAVCVHEFHGDDPAVDPAGLGAVDVRVAAALLYFGLLDFPLVMAEPGSNAGAAEVMWNQAYLGPHFLRLHHSPLVSPLRSPYLDRFPPTYLSVGSEDSLLGHSLDMTRALCAANVPTTLSVVPGIDHAFHYMEHKLSAVARHEVDRTITWLSTTLGSRVR